MNNDDIDNFKKDIDNLRLTKTEKLLMHSRLAAHINNTGASGLPSPYMSSLHRARWSGVYALVALLVLIVPTAYAANHSLPGSPLYAIKIEVLEPVEEALALSPSRRVAATIENAENRIRETNMLLQQEDTVEEVAIASSNLSEKVAKVNRNIKTLDDKDIKKKIDLQKDLLTVLEAYAAIVEDESSIDQATTTRNLATTADSVEDGLRDSIDSFSSTSEPEDVADEVADTIAETEDRLAEDIDEIGGNEDEELDENQRKALEHALVSAQQEINEHDSAHALEILIFSNQAADVISTLNEISEDGHEDGSVNGSATSSVATSSLLQEVGWDTSE